MESLNQWEGKWLRNFIRKTDLMSDLKWKFRLKVRTTYDLVTPSNMSNI